MIAIAVRKSHIIQGIRMQKENGIFCPSNVFTGNYKAQMVNMHNTVDCYNLHGQ